MQVIEDSGSEYLAVGLAQWEVRALIGALNEACNGPCIGADEFHARIGVHLDPARELLGQIVAARRERPPSTRKR